MGVKSFCKKVFNALGYEVHRKVSTTDAPKLMVAEHELDEGFRQMLGAWPAEISEDAGSIRLFTTYKAVHYIVDNEIAGDLIECGVFQGRHIFVMAKTLNLLGIRDRQIYLYDTFAGMTAPSAQDFKLSRPLDAESNLTKWQESAKDGHVDYCYAPIEQVKKTVFKSGYPESMFTFVKGDVRETLPNNNHKKIAILRMDTDFYEATKWQLEHLYDMIVPGGLLIIDDYGSWAGCRKAVDEFIGDLPFRPLLNRTDRSERVLIKP